jgi:hypothetical protein
MAEYNFLLTIAITTTATATTTTFYASDQSPGSVSFHFPHDFYFHLRFDMRQRPM